MPINETEKCAYPRCTCPAPAGQSYCSEECRRLHAHQDEQAAERPCGHALCTSDSPSAGVTL